MERNSKSFSLKFGETLSESLGSQNTIHPEDERREEREALSSPDEKEVFDFKEQKKVVKKKKKKLLKKEKKKDRKKEKKRGCGEREFSPNSILTKRVSRESGGSSSDGSSFGGGKGSSLSPIGFSPKKVIFTLPPSQNQLSPPKGEQSPLSPPNSLRGADTDDELCLDDQGEKEERQTTPKKFGAERLFSSSSSFQIKRQKKNRPRSTTPTDSNSIHQHTTISPLPKAAISSGSPPNSPPSSGSPPFLNTSPPAFLPPRPPSAVASSSLSLSPPLSPSSPRSPSSPSSVTSPNFSRLREKFSSSKKKKTSLSKKIRIHGYLDLLIISASAPSPYEMVCVVIQGDGSDGSFYATKTGNRSQKWEWNEPCTFVVTDTTNPFHIQVYSSFFSVTSLLGSVELKWEDIDNRPRLYCLSLCRPSRKSSTKYLVSFQAQFSSLPMDGFQAHLGYPVPNFPHRLNTGDILLFDTNRMLSKVTSILTASRWDHVAMAFIHDDEVFLLEALLELGVILNYSRRLVNTVKGGGILGVRHLLFDRSNYKSTIHLKIINHICSVLGEPYEKQMQVLLRAGVGKTKPPSTSEKHSWFCSQLVAASYIEMGVLSSNRPAEVFLPKCFAKHLDLNEGFSLSEVQFYCQPPSWVVPATSRVTELSEDLFLASPCGSLRSPEFSELTRSPPSSSSVAAVTTRNQISEGAVGLFVSSEFSEDGELFRGVPVSPSLITTDQHPECFIFEGDPEAERLERESTTQTAISTRNLISEGAVGLIFDEEPSKEQSFSFSPSFSPAIAASEDGGFRLVFDGPHCVEQGGSKKKEGELSPIREGIQKSSLLVSQDTVEMDEFARLSMEGDYSSADVVLNSPGKPAGKPVGFLDLHPQVQHSDSAQSPPLENQGLVKDPSNSFVFEGELVPPTPDPTINPGEPVGLIFNQKTPSFQERKVSEPDAARTRRNQISSGAVGLGLGLQRIPSSPSDKIGEQKIEGQPVGLVLFEDLVVGGPSPVSSAASTTRNQISSGAVGLGLQRKQIVSDEQQKSFPGSPSDKIGEQKIEGQPVGLVFEDLVVGGPSPMSSAASTTRNQISSGAVGLGLGLGLGLNKNQNLSQRAPLSADRVRRQISGGGAVGLCFASDEGRSVSPFWEDFNIQSSSFDNSTKKEVKRKP